MWPCAIQVIRSSADIPPSCARCSTASRSARLTAPEITKFGIEMFAICAKKESSAENTPGKRQARESIMAERYRAALQAISQEIRRGAMLEYK